MLLLRVSAGDSLLLKINSIPIRPWMNNHSHYSVWIILFTPVLTSAAAYQKHRWRYAMDELLHFTFCVNLIDCLCWRFPWLRGNPFGKVTHRKCQVSYANYSIFVKPISSISVLKCCWQESAVTRYWCVLCDCLPWIPAQVVNIKIWWTFWTGIDLFTSDTIHWRDLPRKKVTHCHNHTAFMFPNV